MTPVTIFSSPLTRSQLLLCVLLLTGLVWRQPPAPYFALGLILATAVSVVIIVLPGTIRLALRLQAVDQPGGRRIHTQPTPRLGGLAIGLGVAAALIVTSMHYMPNLRALLIGAYLVLLVGTLDDIRPLPAAVKMLFQLAACVVLIRDGVHVTFLPGTWWGIGGEWFITVFWIVGITNAVNFLDGMDGLVAGLVMGICAIFFVLALLLGEPMLAYCATALFGAAFAFLGFNCTPARMFLGDGGSTFLGFFLAALSVQGGWAAHRPLVSFFIPILVLSVPIYDMVFTTVERIATGKVTSFRGWLEYTGRDHLHHRLEALGLTRGQVVLVICFLNLAVGLGAITLFKAETYGGVTLLIQVICVYAVLALLEVLGRQKLLAAEAHTAQADATIPNPKSEI